MPSEKFNKFLMKPNNNNQLPDQKKARAPMQKWKNPRWIKVIVEHFAQYAYLVNENIQEDLHDLPKVISLVSERELEADLLILIPKVFYSTSEND